MHSRSVDRRHTLTFPIYDVTKCIYLTPVAFLSPVFHLHFQFLSVSPQSVGVRYTKVVFVVRILTLLLSIIISQESMNKR